jgi:hypothetical protein
VPELLDKELEAIPCVHIPSFFDKKLKVIDLAPEEGTKLSLYPYDFVGLYSRPLFMALAGFDTQIASPFWQNLDFGIRAFQWGEVISLSRRTKIRYLSTPEVQSLSQEGGYDRFYLKNYWPFYAADHVEVSFWRFLKLIKPSGVKWQDVTARYTEIREWLLRHRYRFKKDLKGVIELWENTDFL